MLVAERQSHIAQLVQEQGSVRVTELSSLFAVTEETIRRDLDALEQTGVLRRSHGGAVRSDELHAETPYLLRETMRSVEKKAIAKKALTHIESGDQIVLDASSTAYYLAQLLPNMPLQVLTNSLKIAAELATKHKVSVVVTGGLLSPRSLSLIGPAAEQTLERYHVNKAFLSSKGVHPQRGLSESNEAQALVKKRMIEIADTCILLADATKLGVQDFATTCAISEIDLLITNEAAEDKWLAAIADLGVTIEKAPE